jgi:polysaccharide pyruvyl transferase WcaK-like protein
LIEFESTKKIIDFYAKPKLVIGMRGHAQMIPFGCNTPILSIISHDKMQWFLDDINHPEWGIDVLDENFENELSDKILKILNNWQYYYSNILLEQNKLWNITSKNINTINSILNEFSSNYSRNRL